MPELPEVETVVRTLKPQIVGKSIDGIDFFTTKLRYPINHAIIDILHNAIVVGVERVAKYILCYFDNKQVLIMHLGMTGRLYISDIEMFPSKHIRMLVSLSNKKQLVFEDARKFGLIDLASQEEVFNTKYFKNLGIDPLSNEFHSEYLQEICTRLKITVKQLLMDNRYIQGIGNIYASEILFHAKVSPLRLANSLTESEIKALVQCSKQVLKTAIEEGGSSIKDFIDSHGNLGGFQRHFQVYGRYRDPCFKCATQIARLKQGGRSSFWCPTCQI